MVVVAVELNFCAIPGQLSSHGSPPPNAGNNELGCTTPWKTVVWCLSVREAPRGTIGIPLIHACDI